MICRNGCTDNVLLQMLCLHETMQHCAAISYDFNPHIIFLPYVIHMTYGSQIYELYFPFSLIRFSCLQLLFHPSLPTTTIHYGRVFSIVAFSNRWFMISIFSYSLLHPLKVLFYGHFFSFCQQNFIFCESESDGQQNKTEKKIIFPYWYFWYNIICKYRSKYLM